MTSKSSLKTTFFRDFYSSSRSNLCSEKVPKWAFSTFLGSIFWPSDEQGRQSLLRGQVQVWSHSRVHSNILLCETSINFDPWLRSRSQQRCRAKKKVMLADINIAIGGSYAPTFFGAKNQFLDTFYLHNVLILLAKKLTFFAQNFSFSCPYHLFDCTKTHFCRILCL